MQRVVLLCKSFESTESQHITRLSDAQLHGHTETGLHIKTRHEQQHGYITSAASEMLPPTPKTPTRKRKSPNGKTKAAKARAQQDGTRSREEQEGTDLQPADLEAQHGSGDQDHEEEAKDDHHHGPCTDDQCLQIECSRLRKNLLKIRYLEQKALRHADPDIKAMPKVEPHLQLSQTDSNDLGKLTAYLHMLFTQRATDPARLQVLRSGAPFLTLPEHPETMSYIDIVQKVLIDIEPQYLRSLLSAITSPEKTQVITSPTFNILRQHIQGKVRSYAWLYGATKGAHLALSVETVEDMTGQCLLNSIPGNIRKNAEFAINAEYSLKKVTDSIASAIKLQWSEQRKPQRYPQSNSQSEIIQHLAAVMGELKANPQAGQWEDQHAEPWEQQGQESKRCFSCQQEGHRAGDCPQTSCHNCGGKGHYARACPTNRGKGAKGKGMEGKGGKGKGRKGKGGTGESWEAPWHTEGYSAVPPPARPQQPTTKQSIGGAVVAVWECPRCTGQSHSLKDCPNYRGCNICGEKDHKANSCPGPKNV